MADLVYLSWGGTGRAACLRQAVHRALELERGLLYLAVLDDNTFADLDATTMRLVEDELNWLLDAQIDLTKRQAGAMSLDVRVVVRQGDLLEHTSEVVETLGKTIVLVGAPVAVAGHETVADLLTAIEESTRCPVELIEPDDSGDDGDDVATPD